MDFLHSAGIWSFSQHPPIFFKHSKAEFIGCQSKAVGTRLWVFNSIKHLIVKSLVVGHKLLMLEELRLEEYHCNPLFSHLAYIYLGSLWMHSAGQGSELNYFILYWEKAKHFKDGTTGKFYIYGSWLFWKKKKKWPYWFMCWLSKYIWRLSLWAQLLNNKYLVNKWFSSCLPQSFSERLICICKWKKQY